MINYRLLIVLFSLSCVKDLDVNDFVNDFGTYESELRIEAVILSSDNTAIVRIDRTAKLNETDYFNCIDENMNWNFYYCESNATSYEDYNACQDICSLDCILHYYACSTDMKTFVNQYDCESYCGRKCITDDVGEDGVLSEDKDGDGQFNFLDGEVAPDNGEKDGLVSCGEPNVDEFDEILPYIHEQSCYVEMYTLEDGETKSCKFLYDDKAGQFFEDSYESDSIFDAEIINYGAYIPDLENCHINFNNYDQEYTFFADCNTSQGQITASDTLQRPVVFYKEEENGIYQCADENTKSAIYDCMLIYSIDSLKFIEAPNPNLHPNFYSEDSINIVANLLNINSSHVLNPIINYASLYKNRKYQAVQYILNERENKWVYYHGHPAEIPNDEYIINNKIAIFFEFIVAEQYKNENFEIESTKFKYDIFTFSRNYENYYFYDKLSSDDPIRSNLRDENDKVVMGSFGSMAKASIFFEILTVDSLGLD